MSRKKSLLVLLVSMFSVGCLLGFTATVLQGAPSTMSIADDDKVGGGENRAMVRFGEIISQLSGGEIKAKNYTNFEMGDEKEIIEGIRIGTIHATNISTGTLANWVPETALCNLPYVFLSESHVQRCLNGAVGDFIAKRAEMKGFTIVGWYFQDFRNISAKKPIKTLNDAKGLRIRTMEVSGHQKAYSALGMNVIPMAFSELYMALKQNIIDACEPPLTFWWEKKFYEVTNHFSFTKVFYSPTAIIVGSKWFESLPPQQQIAVRFAAGESSNYYNKIRDEDIAKYIKEAKAKGVQFHETDIDPFVKVCLPVQREFAEKLIGKEGPEILSVIEKLGKVK